MTSGSFERDEFERILRERGVRLGSPLTVRAVTGSTNDDALEAARAGAPHGATFVADEQTHGRGRRGRAWQAAAGEGLLVSIVLRLALEDERVGLLPLAVGLAVRQAVAELLPASLAATARVKWPNDVWVGERKIAGVLAEARVVSTARRGREPMPIVVGIGVNVGLSELPEALRTSATSLALLGVSCTRARVLADMLACLELRLARLSDDAEAIVSELQCYDALIGRQVLVNGTSGIAEGVDREGQLRLRLTSAAEGHGEASLAENAALGACVAIRSGSVEVLDGTTR